MLYGIVDPTINDLLLLAGVATCFMIPAITLFDMYQFNKIHTPVATAYFLVSSILLLTYSFMMQRHKEEFSPDVRDKIDRLTYWAWLEFASFLTLAYCF